MVWRGIWWTRRWHKSDLLRGSGKGKQLRGGSCFQRDVWGEGSVFVRVWLIDDDLFFGMDISWSLSWIILILWNRLPRCSYHFFNKKTHTHTHGWKRSHGLVELWRIFYPILQHLQLEKMENELGLGWLGWFDGLKDWVTVAASNIYVLFSPAMRDMIQFD